MPLSATEKDDLEYTITHFAEIARQNRFAENSAIEHDGTRCVICHPERLPLEPLAVYLEVITPAIKQRRPKLDQSLVDEINSDLALMGSAERVELTELLAADPSAVALWAQWLRTAIAVGLDLLSIHSASSLEFDLDEATGPGRERRIEEKIKELMDFQRSNR